MALYGLVVGLLAGGSQLYLAPAKLALGTLLSMLICLPSLYIFSCLHGADARLRPVAGTLFGAVCLSALLLIGFAPVAWIFSESTDSVAFMGTFHLVFWLVGLGFGLRFLVAAEGQMTTTLRPIVGRSEHFLPAEKKFFLAHWWESLHQRGEGWTPVPEACSYAPPR